MNECKKCGNCAIISEQEKIIKALNKLGYTEDVDGTLSNAEIILVNTKKFFNNKRYLWRNKNKNKYY